MDEQVLAAMRKWPDVPAVYGWLRLGRRGEWRLVDRGRPGFDEARDGQGSPITSPPILDFIARNYGHDENGAWYWQNGPQRAFVDLDLAPLLLRVLGEPPGQSLVTHTGRQVSAISQALTDRDGNLWLKTDLGPALIDDRDIGQLRLESPDGAAPAVVLYLDNYPGPWTDRHGARGWPVDTLAAAGAEAIGKELGFQARPR